MEDVEDVFREREGSKRDSSRSDKRDAAMTRKSLLSDTCRLREGKLTSSMNLLLTCRPSKFTVHLQSLLHHILHYIGEWRENHL